MSIILPDPNRPTASLSTVASPAARAEASKFANAVEAELARATATSFRDPTPTPTVGAPGATPPVPQPGRPAMSQKATDASVLMLAGSVASVPLGGSVSLVLYTLGHVEPVVLATGACAPLGLAVLAFTLNRLIKSAGQALPTEQHHHYNAPVHQDLRTTTTQTRGVWATTRNQLPR